MFEQTPKETTVEEVLQPCFIVYRQEGTIYNTSIEGIDIEGELLYGRIFRIISCTSPDLALKSDTFFCATAKDELITKTLKSNQLLVWTENARVIGYSGKLIQTIGGGDIREVFEYDTNMYSSFQSEVTAKEYIHFIETLYAESQKNTGIYIDEYDCFKIGNDKTYTYISKDGSFKLHEPYLNRGYIYEGIVFCETNVGSVHFAIKIPEGMYVKTTEYGRYLASKKV